MRELGFEMSQPVVGKIERGDRKVSIGEAEALADVVGVSLWTLVAGPSNVKLEYADRHLNFLISEVKLAMERFRGGQMALATFADSIGRDDLSPMEAENVALLLDMTPARIAREVEIENVATRSGERAREEFEAAEDWTLNEERYAAGFVDGFLDAVGDTINHTLGAPGFSDAWKAFGLAAMEQELPPD